MKIRKSKKLAAAAVAAAVTAAGVIAGIDATSGSASADTTSAYVDLGPIPDQVLSSLTNEFGVQVSNVLASLPPALTALLQPVTDLAKNELGIDLSSLPTSVSLATVTTPNFGEDSSSDPENPNIAPSINNALTWVVTFDDVTIPIAQRAQDDGSDAGPTTTTATVVEFINPLTSQFEYAIAL